MENGTSIRLCKLLNSWWKIRGKSVEIRVKGGRVGGKSVENPWNKVGGKSVEKLWNERRTGLATIRIVIPVRGSGNSAIFLNSLA